MAREPDDGDEASPTEYEELRRFIHRPSRPRTPRGAPERARAERISLIEWATEVGRILLRRLRLSR